MEIVKYHAQGNDYLVTGSLPPHVSPADVAAALCDRNTGVGADGLLIGPIPAAGQPPLVRIFNADGGETRKSGNGICIFARYLVDAGLAGPPPFEVRTRSGPVTVLDIDTVTGFVRTTMGGFTFSSAEIPVLGPPRDVIAEQLELASGRRFTITGVSLGNPHCVVFLPAVSRQLAERYGPEISRHPLFPEGTNVQFVEILDRGSMRIEIWERGSAYTLASGSSSCAVVCAAHRLGLTEARATVHTPGGDLGVKILPGGDVVLETKVSPVFRAVLLVDRWDRPETPGD
jgi:diaminopimelate epimerase